MENVTCLKFKPRTNEDDYIVFRSRKNDACLSWIGRQGGRQVLEIGPGCEYPDIIMHEVCHALGMWHEQTRPDRDNYINILEDNVEEDQLHNFMKRNIYEVDSIGTIYDYGSVMHYELNAFSKETDLDTMEIVDQELYEQQGRPIVGYVPTLSKLDAIQLNRLYNCPGSGVAGDLKVYIDRAENLKAMTSDVYVMVTAYDDRGGKITKKTRYIQNDANPKWDEWLDFGSRISWQYIDVSIWNNNPDHGNAPLTEPHSFALNPGHHNRVHCKSQKCRTKMTFSFTLTKECHCFNGGTCLSDGVCDCPINYGGPQCEYVRGHLRVYARRGKKFMNKDGKEGNSDVFLEVTAFDHHGGNKKLYTKVIYDNANPVWNEWLDFGENEWSWFSVQAFDEDAAENEWLSSAQTYTLLTHSSSKKLNIRAYGYNGVVVFDYIFEP